MGESVPFSVDGDIRTIPEGQDQTPGSVGQPLGFASRRDGVTATSVRKGNSWHGPTISSFDGERTICKVLGAVLPPSSGDERSSQALYIQQYLRMVFCQTGTPILVPAHGPAFWRILPSDCH